MGYKNSTKYFSIMKKVFIVTAFCAGLLFCGFIISLTIQFYKDSNIVLSSIVCLYIALLALLVVYYRVAKKRLILEQQTELSRTTTELELVSQEKRQLCEQFNKELSFLRQILHAIPAGLYWKNSKGELQGQNLAFGSLLEQSHDSSACIDLIADGKLDMEVLTKGIDLMHVPHVLQIRGEEKKFLVSRVLLKGPGGQLTGMLNCQIPVDSFANPSRKSLCDYLETGCLAEHWDVPMLLIDKDGRIKYANRACEEFIKPAQPLESSRLCSVLHIDEPVLKKILTHASGKWTSICIGQREVKTFIQSCSVSENGMTVMLFADLQNANSPIEHEAAWKDATSDGKPQKTAEILVVDDVEENCKLMEILAAKNGCKPTSCSNGHDAVERCSKMQYDLIFLDIQMPEMDGFETLRLIREGSLNSSTPIIAMTASEKRDDELAALEFGFDDYLSKPISSKRVEQKIWRSLEKVKQVRAAAAGEDIISFLEGNPDYQKAIETFVENLPGRLDEMKDAFENRDIKSLSFKVHSLKGVGGFAGFSIYSEKAKKIEENIKNQMLDKVQAQLDELVSMCQKTRLRSDCQ